ncbi:uncharacterized protein LOC115424503 isoform X2 [Sphaeramia orbicularis]|uniref:uncharacterized protein LOC115424503 isoform X2 n=1 Tax=Sphaeramia orbicularis TaxID=375764 RepID=UPI00117D2DB6|nr:uncharacterized protein LOC115424503 isoform X2 [Sphaeramia orbicularis]
MDNTPHSEEDYLDAASHTQASPCAQINKRPEPEAQHMFSGAEKSPVDKLKLEVRIVLTRITPAASGHHLASAAAEPEAEDNCAQNDSPSCDHTTSGVQVNLLHAEVCTETTDESAPQYIVDEEAILQLMKTCPLCSKQCRCNKYTRGPYFIVYQSCYFCDYRRKWASQPEAINMNTQKRRALCPRQEQGPCKSKHWSQTGVLKCQSRCPTTKLQT